MNDFENIKLIVTDMDGTLLNSDKELPENFFEIIDSLYQKNIRFAIASGRSYPTLADQLKEIQDKLLFVAENGACIVDGHTLVHAVPLTAGQVTELTEACAALKGTYPVYSCLHNVYVPESTPQFVRDIIGRFYAQNSILYIDSYKNIPVDVLKVTVCIPEHAETEAYPVLSRLPYPYQAILGGEIWIDLFLQGSSKGNGIAAMQEKYKISASETMMFGDYLNDISMVPHAYYSYAMANSHPDFSKLCRFKTLSNDEDGVMHIVRQVLENCK